jgi:hypothetical protein
MKTFSHLKRAGWCLALLAIGIAGFTSHVRAAALQGQLQIRPLTPQEVKDYGLTGIQTASGLSTVAVGQPAYFDLIINAAVTNGEVVSVTWSLTNTPAGSAAGLTNSPLGTNVPPYRMIERTAAKVGGRMMIRPDVPGQYTIKVSVVSLGTGSTNLTRTITAGTYIGAQTCALCHSGGLIASNTYTPWSMTAHATAFQLAIDGQNTDHFSQNCIKCHAVGFDANTNANNGGFDDVAKQTGWVFPTTFTNGNWAAMPTALKNVANVQCENCHGPGSQHAFSLGNTNFITVTTASGDCAQCHDSLNHHSKTTEWNNSRHAMATKTPSGPTRFNCVRCHTADGFAQFIDHAGTSNVPYVTNTVYEPITCAACHDPHDASNPHQLRAANEYTLPEGTTITNAGFGALCMECHHSRNGSASNNITNYKLGLPTWAGGSSFGVHDSTAGDMVEGVNGFTYGKFIPSSTHSHVVKDVCVGCHMQPVVAGDPAFTKAGGHTFSMTYSVVTNGVTTVVDKVDVCVKCHGPMEGFNFARKDYDGDGVIQGVQTEVQNLLNQLSRLLPASAYRADGNYVADGLVKSPSVKTNWPTKFLQAAWNWQFVNVEGSHGVHNASYAVGLLKASIADLTDDADQDGISDQWEIANFGSITSYNGNGDPDNDGVKNALEISAGTNPLLADSDGDGVNDLAEMKAGSDPLNNLDLPGFVVKIYTAAEIEFASEMGKRYQVQTVSDLTSSWVNVGSVTNGTGNNISMVTSTRAGNGQGYFRVVQVP